MDKIEMSELGKLVFGAITEDFIVHTAEGIRTKMLSAQRDDRSLMTRNISYSRRRKGNQIFLVLLGNRNSRLLTIMQTRALLDEQSAQIQYVPH